MARLQQRTQAAVTTGSAEGIPTFPARWCYDLYALFPGTGSLAPVAGEFVIRPLGISTGMPEPRDFTVAPNRPSAWRPCCDPTRPPRPAPDVRDDREAPPQWGGMRGLKHDFGKMERGIFLREGLDRVSRFESAGEISCSARQVAHALRRCRGLIVDRKRKN
jgi:hypothetical protein